MPFGVRAEAGREPDSADEQTGVFELAPPVPRAEDFWGEGSAAIHDVVQAPATDHREDRPSSVDAPAEPARRRRVALAGLVAIALLLAAAANGLVRLASAGRSQTLHADVVRSSVGGPVVGRLVRRSAMAADRVAARAPGRQGPRHPHHDAGSAAVVPVHSRIISSSIRPVSYSPPATGASEPAQASNGSSSGTGSGGGGSATSSGSGGGSSGASGSSPTAGPVGPGAPFGPGHLG